MGSFYIKGYMSKQAAEGVFGNLIGPMIWGPMIGDTISGAIPMSDQPARDFVSRENVRMAGTGLAGGVGSAILAHLLTRGRKHSGKATALAGLAGGLGGLTLGRY